MKIAFADADADIDRCFEVMAELRPHLAAADFVRVVRVQGEGGYRLVYLEHDDRVRTVAGFRFLQNLSSGRVLYVDDLVTRAPDRSKEYGRRLFEWLVEHARTHACGQLHLDSGVQRFDAHRFYLARRMHIVGHHFALNLR